MKTFVIAAVAAMVSTASFAEIGNELTGKKGETWTVTDQYVKPSGSERVIITNSKGRDRAFTVTEDLRVIGKGKRFIKDQIRDMVEADRADREAVVEEAPVMEEETSNAHPGVSAEELAAYMEIVNNRANDNAGSSSASRLANGPGAGYNLVDCSINFGVDRIVEVPVASANSMQDELDTAAMLCAE